MFHLQSRSLASEMSLRQPADHITYKVRHFEEQEDSHVGFQAIFMYKLFIKFTNFKYGKRWLYLYNE